MPDLPSDLVVFVIGATGVGKTKLALDLAARLDGEIVGADSIQLYKDFDVASAKPTREQMASVPHHLVDCIDAGEEYNVSRYVREATGKIHEIQARGRTPIVVGGTVQYVTALLWPMSAVEHSDAVPSTRSSDEDTPPSVGSCDALYEELRAVNPTAAAKLHPHDVRRIKRCLELGEVTVEMGALRYPRARVIWLTCDDKEVYRKRVADRVDTMVADGLKEELATLVVPGVKSGALGWNRGPLQGIGYKEFREWVENPTAETWDRCIDRVKTGTVKYSRQQVKWIRNKIEPHVEVCKVDTSDFEAASGSCWPGMLASAVEFVRREPRAVREAPKEEWKKYDCEICGKEGINGPNEWEQHLGSKMHKSRKRKAKQAALRAERSDSTT
ncbi:hypothetical protein FOZ63_026600 [Perkinsus olseni]|uniref:tRNA dimethylallyltransferase n=1 Tax=Perkinsus olseni TaxID=32597 RepID=A0A7J6TRZ2_PEROL|nr:hypothetical protein FOZ63_026600 [Perkinsus olseni]